MESGQSRVLFVHNRYQQRGGEDLAFEAEFDLLEARGHSVERLIVSNDEISERPGPIESARLALNTVWSRTGARAVAERARAFAPDVVHFHNTFPLVSPAALRAARETGAAVVASLHNYRLACPSADLFRDGRQCTDCLGRAIPWPGVRHRCYRDSRAQTAVVASMLSFHRARRTWTRDVDQFLVPSAAVAQILSATVPAARMRVKTNFIADPGPPPPLDASRSGFLYVGRLTVEKGIPELLAAWRKGLPGELTVIGDGPLRSMVEAAARESPQIRFAGEAGRREVLTSMRNASALIAPSVWQEPFGLVVIEAFASGTPVIATRNGALPELIDDGKSGLIYDTLEPDDLVRTVTRAAAEPGLMRDLGQRARVVFEERYSANANYKLLTAAYAEAIRHRRGVPADRA